MSDIGRLLRKYHSGVGLDEVANTILGRRIAGFRALLGILSPLASFDPMPHRITYVEPGTLRVVEGPVFVGCRTVRRIHVCEWRGRVSFTGHYITQKEPDEILMDPDRYPRFMTTIKPVLSLRTHKPDSRVPPVPVFQIAPHIWLLPTFTTLPNPDLEYQVSRKARGKRYFRPYVIERGTITVGYRVRIGVIDDTWRFLEQARAMLRMIGERGRRPDNPYYVKALTMLGCFACILSGALTIRMLFDLLGYRKTTGTWILMDARRLTPFHIAPSTKIDKLTRSAILVCRGPIMKVCMSPGEERRQKTLLDFLSGK